MLAALTAPGETTVTVLPVTHSAPGADSESVEIPPAVKHRLGLHEARSWVVVSEVNRFRWPGPDLRPASRNEPGRFAYGLLPPALFRQIREKLLATAAAQRLTVVPRIE